MPDDVMPRKKLIDYLPPFMQDFAEIKEIMKAEDARMDNIQHMIENILENAFIKDCDIYGIKRYEKIIGIIPDAKQSLEEKKQAVLMHMNNEPPYTYRTLLKKLEALYGTGNYEVSEDLKRYSINVTVHSELRGQKNILETMLNWFLPVNIAFLAKNEVLRYFTIYMIERMDVTKICLHTQIFFWRCKILNGTKLLDGTKLVNSKRRYDLILGMKSGIKFHIKEIMDTDKIYINIPSCFNVHEKICASNVLFKLGDFSFWECKILNGTKLVNSRRRYDLVLGTKHSIKFCIKEDINTACLINADKVPIEEKTNVSMIINADVNFLDGCQQTADSTGTVTKTRHIATVKTSETIENIMVTCRRNVHYLDGSKRVDGSRLLNAFYGKESI